MSCPNCGHEVSEHYKDDLKHLVCRKCRVRYDAPPDIRTCFLCGQKYDTTEHWFCPNKHPCLYNGEGED